VAHIKAEVSRFILIGGLNTLIGLSVIYIFVYIGLNNYLSNAIGYSIGLFVSFILNKYYVFRHNESNKVLLTQIVQFMIIFFIAYGFNLIILVANVLKPQWFGWISCELQAVATGFGD